LSGPGGASSLVSNGRKGSVLQKLLDTSFSFWYC
jgi:hypothetical protein